MAELPDWARASLLDPYNHDNEFGDSCRFCHSHHRHGNVVEHFIDCDWVAHAVEIGVDVSTIRIFEPEPADPCATCGYVYVFEEDWRGRQAPLPQGDLDAHDTHVAEAFGVTLDEYRANPMHFFARSLSDALPMMTATRGGITFAKSPLPGFVFIGPTGQRSSFLPKREWAFLPPYRRCPQCMGVRVGAIGEARHGGGYRLACSTCRHQWDDSTFSYGAFDDHVKATRKFYAKCDEDRARVLIEMIPEAEERGMGLRGVFDVDGEYGEPLGFSYTAELCEPARTVVELATIWRWEKT